MSEANNQEISYQLQAIPEALRPFARVLQSPQRDFRHILLPAGSIVLSLPEPNSPIVEYKSQNFNTPEYQEILIRAALSSPTQWSDEENNLFNSILNWHKQFNDAIDFNFSNDVLALRTFPESKFSWNRLEICGKNSIGSSQEVKDFSETLFKELLNKACTNGININYEKVPSDWYKQVLPTITAKIHCVKSFFRFNRVYVVQIFATPFHFDNNTGKFVWCKLDRNFLETIMKCAEDAIKSLKKGEHVFYTIGTGIGLDQQLAGQAVGKYSLVLSGPATSDTSKWEVRRGDYYTARKGFRNFIDRLMPIKLENITMTIKSYIDPFVLGSGFAKQTTVSVDEVIVYLQSKESPYQFFPRFRKTTVIRAFLQLSKKDNENYAIRQNEGGVFICHPKNIVNLPGVMVDRPYKVPGTLKKFFLFHSVQFFGTALCTIAIVLRLHYMAKNMVGKDASTQIWDLKQLTLNIGLAIIVFIICSIIQNCINKKISMERE